MSRRPRTAKIAADPAAVPGPDPAFTLGRPVFHVIPCGCGNPECTTHLLCYRTADGRVAEFGKLEATKETASLICMVLEIGHIGGELAQKFAEQVQVFDPHARAPEHRN